MRQNIVVVGGGYSGHVAAKLAARRLEAKVTLVNDRDQFVERVRLHQLASGQPLPQRTISGMLEGSGVDLVVDRVTAIDPAARLVLLADGERSLPYDVLVYALGSQADLESVPGAAEHAYSVASLEHALRLRERLTVHRSVAVVGAGLTGIEAVTELAESYPQSKVRLVTNGVLGDSLSERGRRHLRRVFARLGIDVTEQALVSEVRADGLVLADGEHIDADTVVWTTGFRVPELAAEAGFAVDARGRMVVDETLRSVSHPEVYGVGDAAAARRREGQELRMACATGLPSAQHAVRAIRDRQAGRSPKPLRFRYFNQCISLGRRDGLIQFVRGDDTPVEVVLTGRSAALYKELIVRGAFQVQHHPSLPTAI